MSWSSHSKHATEEVGFAVRPDLPHHTAGLPWPRPPANTRRVENQPTHPPVPDQMTHSLSPMMMMMMMMMASSSLEGRRRTGAGDGDCVGSGSGWHSISETKATPVRKRAVSALSGRHPHIESPLPETKRMVGQVAHCHDTSESDLT